MENLKPAVLVTRKLTRSVEERLEAEYQVTLNDSDIPLSESELKQSLLEYDAVLPTVSDSLNAAVFDSKNIRTQIIANVGVGFSHIDLNSAKDNNIAVTNTPDVLTEATADIALYLILSVTRRTFSAEKKLREKRWNGFSIVDGLGCSVQGKVLGIIGMGRIGKATARRASLALGMKVVYFNRSPVHELDFTATALDSIEEVMTMADVVSIHVPGAGCPIITEAHIDLLKPSAYLINTARGDSVDEQALLKALVEKQIAGAGLDVFMHEPKVPQQLAQLENVTLLPHIGSATEEVRTAMGMMAVDNLDAFFADKPLLNKVV